VRTTAIMTPQHARWDEFCERLEGPERCNFRKVNGESRWTCKGGTDKTLATKILKTMGFTDPLIESSLDYFEEHGGMCDCEILFNVDRP